MSASHVSFAVLWIVKLELFCELKEVQINNIFTSIFQANIPSSNSHGVW